MLDQPTRGLSNDAICADLRRVADELNSATVTVEEFRKRSEIGDSLVGRRFGSWSAGLRPVFTLGFFGLLMTFALVLGACDRPMFRHDPARSGVTKDDAITKDAVVDSMIFNWPATSCAAVRSSPAVANKVVYVGSDDHKLYALHANTNCAGSPKNVYSVADGDHRRPKGGPECPR